MKDRKIIERVTNVGYIYIYVYIYIYIYCRKDDSTILKNIIMMTLDE